MGEYFIINGPAVPWGDYGSILVHGMSCHLERNDRGEIQLERTGPFIPPISFPGIGDIVVTTSFRKKLEESGLTGFHVQPVVKAHIVDLDWHRWDRSAREPKKYPAGGEPENYILDRKHSESVSRMLGDLWEIIPGEAARVTKRPKGPNWWNVDIVLAADSVGAQDLFRATDVAYNFASSRAKEWFQGNAGEWIVAKSALVE
jgi:hypothetical protein